MRSEREGGMGSGIIVTTARVAVTIVVIALAGLGYILWQRWPG